MKKFNVLLLIVGALFIAGNVNAQEKKGKKVETVKYWVSMSCENCKAKVEKNIAFEKGVKDMIVDLEKKTVKISYKTKKTNPQKLEKALKDLDFKVEKLEIVNTEESKKENKKKS